MTKLSSGAVPSAQETYVRTGTESDVDDIYVDVVTTEGSTGVATEPDAGPTDPRPRPSHRNARRVRAAVAVADVVAAALALVLGGSIDAVSVPPSVAAMFGSLAWVGLLVSFGAYAIGAGAPVRAVLGAGGVAGVLLVVVAGSPSRSLLLTLVTLVVTALLARIAAGRFQRRARANGSLRLRTAIVDAGGGAPTLDGVLSGDTDMTPVIRIDLTASPGRAPRHDAIPTADVDIHAVPRLLAEHAVGCLLVVGTLQHGELETLRRAARQAGAEFRVAIAVPEVPIGQVTAASAGRAAVVSVSTPSTFGAAFVKRLMDLTRGLAAHRAHVPAAHRDRRRHQGELSGSRDVPSVAGHEGRAAVPDLQVPHDGREPRSRVRDVHGPTVLQARGRSAPDPDRSRDPAAEPRRAPAALERRPGRHEPGRTSPAPDRAGARAPGAAPPPPRRSRGDDGLVAGERPQRPASGGGRRPRPLSTSRTGRWPSTCGSSRRRSRRSSASAGRTERRSWARPPTGSPPFA